MSTIFLIIITVGTGFLLWSGIRAYRVKDAPHRRSLMAYAACGIPCGLFYIIFHVLSGKIS